MGNERHDNSESIYDTTASPFGKLAWGRCTKKERDGETILYLHVFDWPADGELLVPGLKNQVQQAYLLADQANLKTREEDSGTVVSLPQQAPDDIDSVVVLRVAGTMRSSRRIGRRTGRKPLSHHPAGAVGIESLDVSKAGRLE